MKKILWNTFLALGWIILIINLVSAYALNKYADSSKESLFSPITWTEQVAVFNGALSCSLLPDELQDRLDFLKEDLFPKVTHKEKSDNGIVFFFEDKDEIAKQLMEFVAAEKQCCPFFKFDLSVLPFQKGLALKISGGEGVLDFMEGMGFD